MTKKPPLWMLIIAIGVLAWTWRPAVAEAPPAFETPERIIDVGSGGHIQQVAEENPTDEERAHWESRGTTLNAGAGSGRPTDPNRDPLACSWVFNDGTYSTHINAVLTKSWSAAGHDQVLCTASDMKGKRTTRAILVTVGSPNTFTASGNITGPGSRPLEGAYVASHTPSNTASHPSATFEVTRTDSDSDGNHTLTGLAAGSYTISPNRYPDASQFGNLSITP